MGKIKKILENELVGGTQTTDVYPVTSVKAVYDESNERLDSILNRRGVVNISTNYNADHIAEVLTLEQAIAKVPSKDRVLGFQGKFLSENGWKSYVFIGDSIADWTNKTKWNNYLTGTDIVQESGESEDKVMSQKVVSDKFSGLAKKTSYFASTDDAEANEIIKEFCITSSRQDLYKVGDNPITLQRIDRNIEGHWSVVIEDETTGSVYFENITSNPEQDPLLIWAAGYLTFYCVIDWSKIADGTSKTFYKTFFTNYKDSRTNPVIKEYIDNTETQQSISNAEKKQGKYTNILSLATSPFYLNKGNGEFIDARGEFVASDFISTKEGVKYLFNARGNKNVGQFCWYDGEKNFISSNSPDVVGDLVTMEVISPKGTKYLRFCCYSLDTENDLYSVRVKTTDYISNELNVSIEQIHENAEIISNTLLPSSTFLYDEKAEQNGFLTKEGKIAAGEKYATSDYIFVDSSKMIYYLLESHTHVGSVCFYDSSKQFISSISGSTIGTNNFSGYIQVPNNSFYMRYTMAVAQAKRNNYQKVIIYNNMDCDTYSFYDIQSNNGYLNKDNGDVVSDDTWFTSDFITISEGTPIYYTLESHMAVGSITFYDEKKKRLSSVSGSVSGSLMTGSVVTPEGSYYMKYTMYNNGEVRNKQQILYIPNKTNIKGILDRKENISESYERMDYSIHKPYSFSGKNILFFGDSIMFGTTSQKTFNVSSEYNVPKTFCEITGANLKHNYAAPGSVIYEATSKTYSLLKQMQSVTDWNCDCVILDGGTNDWGLGLDILKVEQALRATLTYLKEHTPARVIYILPINVNERASVRNIYDMNKIRRVICDVVLEYGYEYINGELMGFPIKNNALSKVMMADDGIHPTDEGYKMFTRTLTGYIV